MGVQDDRAFPQCGSVIGIERLIVIRSIQRWTVVLVLVVAVAGQAAEPTGQERVENVRTLVEQYVETRQIISEEKQEWELGREMLQERIELMEDEIASLRERIQTARESIEEADTKRAELVEENEALKGAGTKLAGILATLEGRTAILNRRLPEPIQDDLKLLSQQIPEDPNETKLSLSQRFQNVIGLLNEVNKFNRTIEMTNEVRTLADGSVAEVTAIYVGLGQAYYTSAEGTVAGVGRPGPDGWVWQPADDAAKAVTEAVAILTNEKVAGFVPLPVKIQQGMDDGRQ
jgi:hypothetical protein